MSDPSTPALSLPADFEYGEVPSLKTSLKEGAASPAPRVAFRRAGAPAPDLGPLAAFTGNWKGRGLNTIFRPDNPETPTPLPVPVTGSDHVLEINLTSETLSFSQSLGSVPNRGSGAQGDVFLNGVSYLQIINDVTFPGQATGIHAELGMWVIVPKTHAPAAGPTLVRMASIPHGTTINAQGTFFTVNGGPKIDPVDITPFTIQNGSLISFPSQIVTNQGTPRIPQNLMSFLAAGTITQAILSDPNTVLRNAIAGQNIVSTDVLIIDTRPAAPLFGGGTDNIAFLLGDPNAVQPNANVVEMKAIFWIETVEHEILIPVLPAGAQPQFVQAANATADHVTPQFIVYPTSAITAPRVIKFRTKQIQYSQQVFLNFNGLSWPHVSVATLVPALPIPIPLSDSESEKLLARLNAAQAEKYASLSSEAPWPPPEVPDSLVSACASGECVLFVGAELERTLGASTTTSVLAELVTEAKDLAPPEVQASLPVALIEGETERLKDMLQSIFGRQSLATKIAAHRPQPGSRLNDAAKGLGLMPFAGVITLSWDRTLEQMFSSRLSREDAADDRGKPQSVSGYEANEDFFFLRPFGDPDDPDSFVVTLHEFRSVRANNPQLGRILASAFSRNVILFLGCDLEEIEQFIVSANIRAATDRIHFALVPRGNLFSLQKSSFKKSYQIELLGHDPGDPDAIGRFISDLAAKLSTTPDLPIRRNRSSRQESPRLDRIRLVNIGPFADVTIPVERPWTVLLANNGSGKSTILKAIATALAGDDTRVTERAASLLRGNAATGLVEIHAGREKYQAEFVRDSAQNWVLVNLSKDSPIQSGRWAVLGFPAVRGIPVPGTEQRSSYGFPGPLVDDVLPLLGNAADPRMNDLKSLIIDCHGKSEDTAVPVSERDRSRQLRDQLFATLDRLTPGLQICFGRIDYDSTPREVYVKTVDGELPLGLLSQGISSTFGWVGTVLVRLYHIYEDSPDPAREPALLLIDEIDSHLHPKWQQLLAPHIKEIFPNLAVIATSHSPLMVGTLEPGEIVRIRRTEEGLVAEQIKEDYRGYRVDQILTDDAFELETTRDPALEQRSAPLRREYAELLRKPERSADEDERLFDLMRTLEAPLAPPGETPLERAAARTLRQQHDELFARLSDPDFNVDEALERLKSLDRQPERNGSAGT